MIGLSTGFVNCLIHCFISFSILFVLEIDKASFGFCISGNFFCKSVSRILLNLGIKTCGGLFWKANLSAVWVYLTMLIIFEVYESIMCELCFSHQVLLLKIWDLLNSKCSFFIGDLGVYICLLPPCLGLDYFLCFL